MRSLLLLLLGLITQLHAECYVEKVVTGELSLQKSAHNMQIKQKSNQAIINWKSFSLASDDKATFHLPSSSSAILNRVTGKSLSQLDGHISSNGKVYLLNPNGIVIGPKGKIETKGFVATTMSLSDEAFLENKDLLFKDLTKNAVVNLGTISCEKGDIALFARKIINKGKVTAKKGSVSFASGYEILLKEKARDPIWIKPSSEDLDITNEGTIEALSVTLKASNNNPYSLAIQQKGVIDAKGITKKDGKVILSAENNTIEIAGEIKASKETNGGKIQIEADRIYLKDGSSISADGKNSGGTILIGGGFQGNDSNVYNAKELFTEKKVNLSASSLEEGNGGTVILWGDNCNLFYGNITANGGTYKGNGGLIEISSLKELAYKGKAIAAAPLGKAGTLLLDPSDITIVNGAAGSSSPSFPTSSGGGTDTYNPAVASATLNDGDINSSLGAGTNVTVQTSGGTTGTGNITIDEGVAISWGTTATLTLIADAQLFKTGTLASSIESTGTGTFTAMDFQANTSNAITGNFIGIELNPGLTITTVDGDITMEGHGGDQAGNHGIQLEGDMVITSTGAGDITLTGVGCGPGAAVNLCRGMRLMNDASTGVSSSGSGTITLIGSSNATADNNDGILIESPVTSSGTGNISITGTGASGSGANAGEGVRVNTSNGVVQTSSSGNIIINATGGQDNNNNNGCLISGGIIESTAVTADAGTISITTVGGPATTTGINNTGFSMTGSTARVSSVNGNITIDASSEATGSDNAGSSLSTDTTIESTGTGADAATITFTQSSGSGGGNSPGLVIDGGTITTVDGDIGITAAGGSTSTNNAGISLLNSGVIESTGTANITLDATGNGTDSAGVFLNNGQLLLSGSGDLTLTGTSVGSSDGLDMNDAGDRIGNAAASGNFTIIADTISMAGQTLGTGNVTLRPPSASTSIGIGTGAAGTFNLDSTEISTIQSGFNLVTIADAAATGSVDIQAVTVSNPTTINGSTISINGTLSAGANNVILNIGPAQAGTFNSDAAISTTGSATVNGGAFNDIFNINLTTSQTVTLNGNGGTNALNGPDTTNSWSIISDNGGSLNSTIAFSDCQNLTGGTGSDTFTFSGAFQISGATGIDGGTGTNTLVGPNVNNSWAVTSTNSGTITPTGATGASNFSNIQNLTGGSSNDIFVLSDNVGVGGTIDGTSASGNAIDYSAYTVTNVNINLETSSATNLGGFANIQSFTGGSATNSVTGENAVNSWSITGDDAFSVSGISFTPFQNITGGTAADTFTFSGAFQISGSTGIDGGGGANTIEGPDVNNSWTVASDNGGTLTPTGSNGASNFTNIQNLTGGTGSDTFTFSGAFQISGATGIDGGTGTNTLTGPGVNNTWAVTSTNAGTITPTGASGASNFTNIQNLTGGSSNDSFVLSDNVGVGGTIDGTSASGNAIDYSAYTVTNVNINLETSSATNLGGFANIQSFTGGSATNSVTGENAVNSWSITGDDTFSVSGISFTPFQNITGGTAADTFTFTGAFQISGATGIDGGTGSNNVIGPNVNNSWAVTTTDAGTITPTGASGASNFTNIQNLTGGSANDTFVFSDNVGVSGAIDGTSSSGNTLDYSAYTVTDVNVNLQASSSTNITGGFSNIQSFIGGSATNSITGANSNNTWNITADNTGNVGGISFTTFQNLTGGSGNDNFNFAGAFQITGAIIGADGSNTITGPGVNNSWAVTSNNGGTITPTGSSGATSFTTIQNLTGGSANDTFTISDGVSVSGTINGGSSSGNEIDYSAYTSNINVNLESGTTTATGGFSNIQSFIGGSATNSITGANSNNTWNITADNTGNVGGISFTTFQNLTGGSGNDNFTFTGAFQITGAIIGADGSNTITGPGVNNSWAVTSNNGGTITPTGSSGATSFTTIQNLTGGSANDTFTISDGVSVSGTINGGSSSGNSLDLSAYTSNTSVNLANNTSTAGGISNIQSFTGGSATNSITASNTTNTWTFSAENTGTINGSISFAPFQNVTGGNMNDTFDFSSGFIVTGTVNGGVGGSNNLKAPNSINTWNITAENAGNVGSISFTGIQNVTGGTLADTFLFSDQVRLDGQVDGGAPGEDNTLDYSLFTTPVVVMFTTDTSGNASNLGDGFVNIDNVIQNVMEVSFALKEEIFTSLSLTTSTEAQRHRMLPTRSTLDYGQFDNAVCLPFEIYPP